MEPTRKELGAHPRESANIFSRLTFAWVYKIFWKNYKEKITSENIWGPYSKHGSTVLGDRLETQWNKQVKSKKGKSGTPSLMVALFFTFWKEIIFLAVIHVFQHLIDVLLRPKMLGLTLSYFNLDGGADKETALYSGGGLLATTFVTNLMMNHFLLEAFTLGMQMRAACVSLVYRKALRMSRSAMAKVSAGQIVNLVSNDVSRFDMVAITMHYLWSAPLLAALVCSFLYSEVGPAGFAGMAIVFTVAPLQSYAAKLTTKYRRQIAKKTDERIRLTDEMLGGIHVIKMYAWEKPFHNLLEQARANELSAVRMANYLRGSYMTFNLFTTRMALFCTLITYVLSGNSLNAGKVFVIAAYFGIMSATMTGIFVRGVAEVAECFVSIKRLQTFLLNDEVTPLLKDAREDKEKELNGKLKNESLDNVYFSNEGYMESEIPNKPAENVQINLKDATASWENAPNEDTLSNLNLSIANGGVVVVVGTVGAGKSSLLQLILGEMKIKGGEVSVVGSVSYTSQESWLFGGTVMQNILLGLPLDKNRYQNVIQACCLTRDLELFPNGDQTLVGERGASLSGGQRARINLARAVYKEADIYVLDDPLSAVDAHVAKKLFQDCIRGFLKGKIVVLATHQLQFVPTCDQVVYLQEGRIKDQGTAREFMEREQNFGGGAMNAANVQLEREADNTAKFKRMISFNSIRSVSVEGDDISVLNIAEDEPIPVQKSPKEPLVEYKGNVFYSYVKAGTGIVMLLFCISLLICSQFFASACDIWMSRWTTLEELENSNRNSTIDDETPNPGRVMNISIYGAFIVSLLVTAFARGIVFYTICINSSKGLHTRMISSILSTDLSFFNKNPSGSILNRFSRDLGSTDELLPKSILDSCQVFGQVMGAIITSMIVKVWFAIPVFIFTSITVTIRHYYMKTSLSLKHIENTCRSPVFTHLNASLQGLTTIRAHGSQKYLTKHFDLHQDLHTSSLYTFLSAQQGYSYGLDLLGMVYLSSVIFTFIIFSEGAAGAEVGLAITQTLVITSLLQWGMRQSTEVANLMTSVERLLTFTQIPKEEQDQDLKTIPNFQWPSQGEIKCKDLVLKYEKDGAPALQIPEMYIKPGEKIGIVGRTGAGKSSLMSALFRLAHVEGQVQIDGVDTATIPFNYLRSKIAIIPQNPLLFSGNLRRNLDPFSQYPDYTLWRALNEVDLHEVLKDGNGLDTKIGESGNNLSVGQKQLICLARAIVKNSKIIILDEATASIDPETDNLIQKTIRTKFNKCTVLAIAHRLNTVMDSDRIIVMDAGCMVEFDTPLALLEDKNSYFYKLVQETGRLMAAQLVHQAQQAYLRKYQESLEE